MSLSVNHARVLLGCIARRCASCKRPATRAVHFRFAGSSPHSFNALVCDDDACKKDDPRWVFVSMTDLEEANAVRELYVAANVVCSDRMDVNIWERTVSYGSKSS